MTKIDRRKQGSFAHNIALRSPCSAEALGDLPCSADQRMRWPVGFLERPSAPRIANHGFQFTHLPVRQIQAKAGLGMSSLERARFCREKYLPCRRAIAGTCFFVRAPYCQTWMCDG